jgi:cytochrome c553
MYYSAPPSVMQAFQMSARLVLGLALAGAVHTATASQVEADERTQAALELDAHPRVGAREFKRDCQSCHGADALGAANGSVPILAGQRFTYLVHQMADFGSDERDSKAMHHIMGRPELHDPQSWVDIASYLNKAPIDRSTLRGDDSHVSLGRGIFQEQCASCHQADARGSDDGYVPSLRNQNYGYLVNQIHALADDRRHNIDEDLMRFMRSFELDDVHAVADYLSRLEGAGRDRKRMLDNGVVVD